MPLSDPGCFEKVSGELQRVMLFMASHRMSEETVKVVGKVGDPSWSLR